MYRLGVLIGLIQSELTDDLRRKPWKQNPDRLAGHCYVASEALYHLLGGSRSGLRSAFIRHEGSPHWFLIDEQRNVLDPTAAQFRQPVPYRLGRGKGFLTKRPSKRAQIVIDAVLATNSI